MDKGCLKMHGKEKDEVRSMKVRVIVDLTITSGSFGYDVRTNLREE